MKKKIILSILGAITLLSLGIYLLFFYSSIGLGLGSQTKKVYTLFLHVENQQQQITSANVLFYWYPKNFFFLYRLSDKVYVPSGSPEAGAGLTRLFELKPKAIQVALKKFYNIEIDFNLSMQEKDVEKLFSALGGTAFFNIYSSQLSRGEVFISGENYKSYLDGISDERKSLDASISLWYALLTRQASLIAQSKAYRNSYWNIIQYTSGNLRLASLRRLLKPLQGQAGQLYFQSQTMNLEYSASASSPEKLVYLPFQSGDFDRHKIQEQLLSFFNEEALYKRFPISMQINNTTDIKRIAAKTAGVFRLKKIDVKEYINSALSLNHSTLLDFAHSPVKTAYVKKITKISKVYPQISYRDDFDFALYIANDFYGIALLDTPKQKPITSSKATTKNTKP